MAEPTFHDIEPWRTAVLLITQFGDNAANEALGRCKEFVSNGQMDEGRTMMSVMCAVLALSSSYASKDQNHRFSNVKAMLKACQHTLRTIGTTCRGLAQRRSQ